MILKKNENSSIAMYGYACFDSLYPSRTRSRKTWGWMEAVVFVKAELYELMYYEYIQLD